MANEINLVMPEGWQCNIENTIEENGPVSHFEAEDGNGSEVEIFVGPMPPDSSAEEEAFLNYADMVGWDENDPEDQDPLTEWPFNNRKAFGFEALCEDDSPLRVMCCEVKKDLLLVMTANAPDDNSLADLMKWIEAHLRIR